MNQNSIRDFPIISCVGPTNLENPKTQSIIVVEERGTMKSSEATTSYITYAFWGFDY